MIFIAPKIQKQRTDNGPKSPSFNPYLKINAPTSSLTKGFFGKISISIFIKKISPCAISDKIIT
jgi:hypothetical protein